jgi:hypothetical protein
VQDTRRVGLVLCASLVFVFVTLTGFTADSSRYASYRDRAEVASELAAMARENPGLAELQVIGDSVGGHPIHVLRLAGAGAVPPDERPAVFVGANVAGYHNTGTEAALHLARTLIEGTGGGTAALLTETTFFIAPVLNPDAHDAVFGAPRVKRSGNGMKIDRDRDGFEAEDGFDDLDGDGRITTVRIPDPAGAWLPHPDEPRLMVKQDPARGWVGAYRLVSEGDDDDGDGEFNEDPPEGITVDNNFPHAFPYPEAAAGPWASYAPEAKAILDAFFARRNVAAAVIYGPANYFFATPEGLGKGADTGSQKFKLPKFAAQMLGFDPDQEYTIDEVWEVAKDQDFVRQQGITKEDLAQFLGAGPATKFEEADLEILKTLGKDYKERLKQAGLDDGRPGAQSAPGGLTPWLYYQFGVLAIELDVWGIPKAEKKKAEGEDEPLTLDRLEEMTTEQFLALDVEVVAAFLEEMGAPPQFTAERLIERIQSGQATPEQIAKMARQMGGGNGGGDAADEDSKKVTRARDVLAWLDANDPGAVAGWTPVTLEDGTAAEAGGTDPFAEIAPHVAMLEPALKVHTETVLDLAGRLARIEIASLEVVDLGGGVGRVEAVATNPGRLPSHTKMAVRTKSRLPVRLELETGNGVELITGQPTKTSNRLEAQTGTLKAEWLVRAKPGATITVRAVTENAGLAEMSRTVEKGGSR